MGMDLNTYVGPYLAYMAGASFVESYDLTGGRLCDVVDESSAAVRAILPNVGPFGLRFSSDEGRGLQRVIDSSDIISERESFAARFAADIARIKERTQVRVVWGIVSYWS